ncbi:unnamed protein product [Larinioides sclopetarius]|uniref:UBC core domain-containing protein n=1 Tax=Larinioides sclopetarius TaxID=280406 RepID=A0AAV2AWM1_9ARAC
MKPPSIILLTPNGRFETNKKICLSISGHHPESWQPSWSIRTALLAIIGFLPTHGNGAIGSLDYTPEERKHLALKSQDWKCPECGYIKGCLKSPETDSSEKNDVHGEETDVHGEETDVHGEETDVHGGETHVYGEETDVHGEETVFLSSTDGNTPTEKTDVPNDNDVQFEKTTDMEDIRTDSVDEHYRNTSNDIGELEKTDNENTLVLRQRNIASSRLSAESAQSDNVKSVQSDNVKSVQSDNAKSAQSDNVRSGQSSEVKSVQNYGSLVMIWVISVILFILIVRRWLCYDNSL